MKFSVISRKGESQNGGNKNTNVGQIFQKAIISYPLIHTHTLGTYYMYVLKSWGYFLWNNRFLYIVTDATENSPRILHTYLSKNYLFLRSK